MHTSNLVIVRGGLASGKAFQANLLADLEARVALDLEAGTVYSPSQAVTYNLFDDGNLAAVHKLLKDGRKVVISDTFSKRADIDSYVALCPDAVVLEMGYGQRPQDWEDYPSAVPLRY